MKILSIDAWGNADDGYDWNSWRQVGTIEKADFEMLKSHADYIQWFYDNDYTTSIDGASINDSGYNIVICDEASGEPIFAIEYGKEY